MPTSRVEPAHFSQAGPDSGLGGARLIASVLMPSPYAFSKHYTMNTFMITASINISSHVYFVILTVLAMNTNTTTIAQPALIAPKTVIE
jgi:hypothetical protein